MAPPPKRPFADSDDDTDSPWSQHRPSRPPPSAFLAENATNSTIDDDEDPLDAFMKANNESAAAKTEPQKNNRLDLDDTDDFVESYAKAMKAKGIDVGSGAPAQDHGVDYNSDEEVYATARALEGRGDPADLDGPSDGKKEIEPLARVDHSKIEYIEIEKNLLQEHPDIAALTDADVMRIRRELDMRVSGHDIAKPCISFAHFMFEDCLLSTISKAGFSTPTAIQQQAVPVVLNGRDLIAVSKTGSGKTAAFVWPMIVHMMDQPELEWGDGPIGLILAPTRELASQIYTETKKFGKAYSLKSAVVYGGASKTDQFKELRNGGIEILVATPGRLIDLVKMKAVSLKRVSFLVLDEADRMFDLGFEPQVRSICNAVRPDRQTLLFSATFAKRIEYLARDVLTDPIRITIGNVGQSNTDVEQIIQVLRDDSFKWDWLTQRLKGFVAEGIVIIFIGRKAGVDELATNLSKNGFPCTAFHGDLLQHERDRVIQDCKANRIQILVATDVAARGLDIKQVRTVINFDVARDIDSHVHRCGRTGRAGEKGRAYTLITQKEDRFAAELVGNLEAGMQPVPPELMALAMKNPRFQSMRSGGGGGRGGRGGGRGRGGRGRGRGGIGFGAGFGGGASNPNMMPVGRGGAGFSSNTTGGFGNRGGFGFNQPPRGGSVSRGGIQFQKSGSDWKSTSFR